MKIEQAIERVKNDQTETAIAIDGNAVSVVRTRKINGFNRLYYQYVSETHSEGYIITATSLNASKS